MQTRKTMDQVKAYFSAVENAHNPFHEAGKDTNGRRVGRGKSCVGQAQDSILKVLQLTELKQAKEWDRYPKKPRNGNGTQRNQGMVKTSKETKKW